MATTSGRPAELHHSPPIQETVRSVNGVARRVSQKQQQGYRRDQQRSDYLQDAPVQPPAAPEVPRGPPISYRKQPERDGAGSQPDNSRSFSQRAKGRPFAREAFADDGAWEDFRDTAAQKPAEQRRRHDGIPSLSVNTGTGGPTPLPAANDVRRRNSVKQTPIPNSEPLESDQPTYRTLPGQSRHVQRVPESKPRQIQPNSPLTRSSTRDRVDGITEGKPRKEWASDRSPLQKLEVTLNDISKEEKRARVEEAEMLLRESKAGPANHRPKQEATPTSTTAPASKASEQLGRTRIVNDQHPDNPHYSASTGPRKPRHEQRQDRQTKPSAGDKVMPEMLHPSREPPPEKLTVSDDRHLHPAHKSARSSTKQRASNPAPEARDYEHPQEPQENRRATSMRQTSSAPPTQSSLSNITRAVSLQQQGPQALFAEDREVNRSGSLKESNSSHKAALAETPTTAASENKVASLVGRSNSRKLQKAPPAGHERSHDQRYSQKQSLKESDISAAARHPSVRGEVGETVDGRRFEHSKSGLPKNDHAQQTRPQRNREAVGLGLYESFTVEKPVQRKVRISDEILQKPRQHSVSFKEPYDKKPVNEWKRGEIAKLTMSELALDAAAGYESDSAWWESTDSRRNTNRSSGSKGGARASDGVANDRHVKFNPPLYLKCGPLLRYTGMRKVNESSGGAMEQGEIWRGSVMIVTQDSQSSYERSPILRLFAEPKDLLPPPPDQVEDLAPEYVDPIAGLTKLSRTGTALYVKPVDHLEEEKDLSRIENDDGLFEDSPSPVYPPGQGPPYSKPATNKRTRGTNGETLRKFKEVKGVRLHADPDRDVTFWRFKIEVELGENQAHIAYRINKGPAVGFWVPARGQSMNIMFHSCNGFSMSVSPDQFSGPDPLWRDVLNCHQTRPFHLMIGGGDQIYNDRVTVETEIFAKWINTKNPHDKHHTPFTWEMKQELETYYLDRYAMWFSQGLFGMANSQIPMVNIWDDHDIIDGFGSYPDHFMSNPVFMGLGEVAFKYYMLFQHQSVPEETSIEEPSWIIGKSPGPYIKQQSRSVFMHLGKHVALLGLDCRTERKRDEILTDDTYDIVFERCRREIVEGETKHLLVLLGVPVTYPRLVWLENILTSRAMDPIKALGRVGLFRGGFLNKFDGGVEILDDLDDHWTATHHKDERHNFVQDLQDLAAERSVRITLLGGDVHLAAIGQFYSNPKLKIPKDKDHRYMPNVISSAIVNTPPPELMADTLNKRNKIHHLDHYTDEDMIPMFTHDVDGKKRNNKRLLPRRNWCSIREYQPGSTPPPTPPESDTASRSGSEAEETQMEKPRRRFSLSREDANPRKLFRRLSSRGAPPSSYRDDMNPTSGSGDHVNQHAGSAGNLPSSRQNGSFGPPSASFTPQRASFDSANLHRPQTQHDEFSTSFDQPSSVYSTAPNVPIRPIGNFQRRPTNLSEKAARKSDIHDDAEVGLDHKGNIINDYLNLEGGLDIILNCEVNQKDPAGITTPYRLLVPALWYDGSSDREKIYDNKHGNEQGGSPVRKPTLMKRLGFGKKRDGKPAQSAGVGVGVWDQESRSVTESYSESEFGEQVEEHEEDPKRGSGGGAKKWFGGLHRKEDENHSGGQWSKGGADQLPPPPTTQRQGQQQWQGQSAAAPAPAPARQEHLQVQSRPQTLPPQQVRGGRGEGRGQDEAEYWEQHTHSPTQGHSRQEQPAPRGPYHYSPPQGRPIHSSPPPLPPPSQAYGRGYSGVEAYRDKPKRRWF